MKLNAHFSLQELRVLLRAEMNGLSGDTKKPEMRCFKASEIAIHIIPEKLFEF